MTPRFPLGGATDALPIPVLHCTDAEPARAAVVTPVDIFMRKEIPKTVGTIFYIGMFLNFLFFIDLYINLNRAYRQSRQQGGRWVTNRGQIIANYARGWLVIDCISAIPFDFPVAFEMIDLSNGGRSTPMAPRDPNRFPGALCAFGAVPLKTPCIQLCPPCRTATVGIGPGWLPTPRPQA